MHGVIRFLDTEILPASAPEDFPKVIKSGIDEEGQHYKSPAITGPDGIATLLHRIGYQKALERLLDTEGTENFDLRVRNGEDAWLKDVYVQRRGTNVEIGFINRKTGCLAHHGVRYIIKPDLTRRAGRWVPQSTSDAGSPWGGAEKWVRIQGGGVTKAIWYNKLWDVAPIDISWSGMSQSDKDELATFMQERQAKLAEKEAQERAKDKEEKTRIRDHGSFAEHRLDVVLMMQRYHKKQMSCRADCGEENPKMRCAKCKFTRYCSRECQMGDWQYHKSYCGTEEPVSEQFLTSLPTV
ncbi:hypothetical protein VNI00_010653 [Paramarasmius palmivorus]|uniref:MYND-type domain-containing protein n=1 Tax=Paramarasmius palmivorus TaxID=297713 RepID=A0AAW0CJA3_9AGAR